ncbi:Zn-dependent hydrolase [Bradyrhizobium sp. LHD-71]|uniref:Zn-dependent hydrolase n=1 Tax=Bradyrhizobium sp. LHD-71 TaxID=3072141 RepID=UPI00280CBEB7|nr:Zn-dependent hydrolase [Bradyrhizobium sp. LHD-71]MDQ8732363.1 Zn-dependent hydrolase [Bradyrhizobium sp. LHD-71]
MTKPDPEIIKAAVASQRDMVEAFFARLAERSRAEPGITRDTYGEGENWGHRVLLEHGQRTGLHVRTDAAANTYVTLFGRDRTAPRILMGSHLDSVPHGGNFDGAAGVLAGLVAIAVLQDLDVKPACDITAMGIRAEESVWFEVSYIGSRGALGTLPEDALDAKRIDTGRTLSEHIAACGGRPQQLQDRERELDPAAIRAFIEVHIEQAPSLLEAGYPIAICTGIPGNFRYPNVCIVGRHDHVGTPRRFRRDAAMAAVAFANDLDRRWAQLEAAGTPLAITFGRFHTDAGLHGMTTVPGEFHFSLDVRAYDPALLDQIEGQIPAVIQRIEAERKVTFDLGKRAAAPVGVIDPAIAMAMTATAERLGIRSMPLGSPASHDSAAFAAAGVPTCMLFVRNEHGSHNPKEHMEIDDFLDACAVLTQWVVDNAS